MEKTVCAQIRAANEKYELQLESLTQKQIARLYAIMKSNNITGNMSVKFVELIKSTFKITNPEELNRTQYDQVCNVMIPEFAKKLGSSITQNSEPVKTGAVITKPQVARLYAIMKANNIIGKKSVEFLELLNSTYKISSPEELEKTQYSTVCDVMIPDFAKKAEIPAPMTNISKPFDGESKVTPQQIKRMYAIMSAHNIVDFEANRIFETTKFIKYIEKKFGVKINDLTRTQYDEVCNVEILKYAVDNKLYIQKEKSAPPPDRITKEQQYDLFRLIKASFIKDEFYTQFVELVKQKYHIKLLDFLTQSQLDEVRKVIIPKFVKDNNLENGNALLYITKEDVIYLKQYMKTWGITKQHEADFFEFVKDKFSIDKLEELKRDQYKDFINFVHEYCKANSIIDRDSVLFPGQRDTSDAQVDAAKLRKGTYYPGSSSQTAFGKKKYSV